MVGRTWPSPGSGRASTFGGGGGGGDPKILESRYLPRTTGDVLVEYDVTVRILA
jgi:hypothetical protein